MSASRVATLPGGGDRLPPGVRRARHRLLAHTADAGLAASAPSLDEVFEEAARAFADLTVERTDDSDEVTAAVRTERVLLQATDLPALAVGWLNELIALGELAHGAVLGARDVSVEPPSRGDDARLAGQVLVAPFGRAVRPRTFVKSATYHRVRVQETPRGWRLVAFLDL